jgi:hypothetical protein
MPKKFRKQGGAMVEAVQFDGTSTAARMIYDWIGIPGTEQFWMDRGDGMVNLVVETPRGGKVVRPTEWVVQAIDGELAHHTAADFEATYEPA